MHKMPLSKSHGGRDCTSLMIGRLFISLACFAAAFSPLVWAEEAVSFNRHVRSILSENCYYCHGPDEETQEADLRLDTFAGATRDLGGYAAIVPGDPDASELIYRIEDHGDPMPPKKSKKAINPEQLDTLKRWIKQGAKYEPHWSFMPVKAVTPPEPQNSAWVKNEIDRFVLSRLEREGIAPSAEADRETLIRRLSIDLTGLLPSPEELAAYLSDESTDAYEKLVDRYLASPHYGERWGRHWLDQARYADSNGYSVDSERQMWPYRDWVIAALNRDLPFDQFTIDQIAGDLLPKPSKSQLVATGFHRNTLINQEGGSNPEQFRVEAAIDRVNTTGAVWLGLTLACAQCHTHKFDPIQHREYFEMYAFFNSGTDRNNSGQFLAVKKGEMFGKPVHIDEPKLLSKAEKDALRNSWTQKKLNRITTQGNASWVAANPIGASTTSGEPLQILEGGSFLVEKHLPFDGVTAKVATELSTPIRSLRLRVLTHPSLPKKGPGTAGNGNFVLTDIEILANGQPVGIRAVQADHSQPNYPIADAIDDDPQSGWAINVGKGTAPGTRMNAPHEAILILEKPIDPGSLLEVKLHHHLNGNYLVGHFAIDTSAGIPLLDDDQQLLTALRAPQRDNKQKALIDRRFFADHPVAKLSAHPSHPHRAHMMIMRDLENPRDTYLLTRGDFTRPDKDLGKLYPGGLASVQPPLPAKAGRNRLDLAKWLVAPENPLTSRVTMNRMWMRYFGLGIVETEEDFGSQGSLPSHPDLLDWLAGEFIRRDWSMKAMHRLIVTSATYRQSSHARPDLAEIDPRNLLLARQNRLRFDAEIVRDAALSASGLLHTELGGPSVYPPQPDGVYAFTQRGKNWRTAKGDDRYRRAMYTMFFRSAPYPLFTTFDAPDFSSVCTRRVKSNTPLQALNLANDPVFMEFARALAQRLAQYDDIDDQIDMAYQICLSREPSPQEILLLRGYVKKQRAAYDRDTAAASQFTSKEKIDPALVALARVMFNTDNFITRE